jgi:hypothetical protein
VILQNVVPFHQPCQLTINGIYHVTFTSDSTASIKGELSHFKVTLNSTARPRIIPLNKGVTLSIKGTIQIDSNHEYLLDCQFDTATDGWGCSINFSGSLSSVDHTNGGLFFLHRQGMLRVQSVNDIPTTYPSTLTTQLNDIVLSDNQIMTVGKLV